MTKKEKQIKELIIKLAAEEKKAKALKKSIEGFRSELLNLILAGYSYQTKIDGKDRVFGCLHSYTPVFSIRNVYKLLGLRNFLKVVKVSITELRKLKGDDWVDEHTEDYDESEYVKWIAKKHMKKNDLRKLKVL